ncbi:methyl-accepting chemotaxis protein [Terasakiella sp.]|uniref:methyl-accepting chemotaxis protein n=1 Tax=Terasakiella sp. TaxID=2034861 RepID=UPI003AA88521
MTTTTIDSIEQETSPQTKRGLGTKIILLGILPVLFMAALNLGVSFKTGNLFENTLDSLNQKAEHADDLMEGSVNVQRSLTKVRNSFAALTNFHQRSILQRDKVTVFKTREMRTSMENVFVQLQQDVSALEKAIQPSIDAHETPAKRELAQKRLNYLLRTADNLPRLFKLFAESNERSLVFLGNQRADQAASNFIYEEVSRQLVIQNTLDHSASILTELLLDTKIQANKDRIDAKQNAIDELSATEKLNYGILTVVSAVLILLTIIFATKKISAPLVNMVQAMARLSKGELDVDIPENQKDEIGDMASALGVFKQNLIDTQRMSEERAQERERLATEQREQRDALATEFEDKVGEVVNSVASSSTQLQATARDMSEIAATNQQRATSATNAANNATTNVHTVSSAAEELSNSINEIARQVSESSTMAAQAATQAETTNVTMRDLAEAANKIGEVISLITDIAEQTNLLALNATIEAARAGEAGKGFAVVASEVKNLANQTAKATDEISHQITTIQGTTQNAVDAIDEVSKMIDHMNEVSSAIAAAVEQQGAATQEIASNVEQAAHSTQDASNDMVEVSQSAERNGQAAKEVLDAAEALSSQSTVLREQVDNFLDQIRKG